MQWRQDDVGNQRRAGLPSPDVPFLWLGFPTIHLGKFDHDLTVHTVLPHWKKPVKGNHPHLWPQDSGLVNYYFIYTQIYMVGLNT